MSEPRSLADLAAEYMEGLKDKKPLVVTAADGFIFPDGGGWDYDISFEACRDAGSALRWVQHMAGKEWVTKEHLAEFARVAAEHFGAPY